MNRIVHLRTKTRARVWNSALAALALTCLFGTANQAAAQKVTPPTTPTKITPPEGATAFLLGRAVVGTQGYVCLPTSPGASTASWTTNAARPEATLFTSVLGKDVQIITHFLSPNTHPNKFAPNPLAFGNATWQSSFDTSKVWAQGVNAVTAGTDSSCPNSGSIACLLLQVIGSEQGPTGGNFLTQTSFIQRLNTNGGSAPADGCTVAADVGKQALVPYTADYWFFKGGVE
jgi:Protein of unknown function (DUF3455)